MRDRYIPFRILAHLLYGTHQWLRRLPSGFVVVENGPAARFMRVSSSRLGEALEWLRTSKFIESLERQPGLSIVRLRPLLSAEEVGQDFEDD